MEEEAVDVSFSDLSTPDWALFAFYIAVIVLGALWAWKWPPRR
jgi:hypothetical protein